MAVSRATAKGSSAPSSTFSQDAAAADDNESTGEATLLHVLLPAGSEVTPGVKGEESAVAGVKGETAVVVVVLVFRGGGTNSSLEGISSWRGDCKEPHTALALLASLGTPSPMPVFWFSSVKSKSLKK